MGAIRLLDDQGQVIGTVILDRKELENEIVNGTPELRLAYTNSLTNVLSFTLEVIPPETITRYVDNGIEIPSNDDDPTKGLPIR